MAYIEKEVERSVFELRLGKLLSQPEIRLVIKERTHYAENKFRYTRQDYLRYIEYEKKLFRLTMLRSQKRRSMCYIQSIIHFLTLRIFIIQP